MSKHFTQLLTGLVAATVSIGTFAYANGPLCPRPSYDNISTTRMLPCHLVANNSSILGSIIIRLDQQKTSIKLTNHGQKSVEMLVTNYKDCNEVPGHWNRDVRKVTVDKNSSTQVNIDTTCTYEAVKKISSAETANWYGSANISFFSIQDGQDVEVSQ